MCSLNMADCHQITNSASWSITGLFNLKEVDLSRCLKFTDSGLKHLISIQTLEKLYILETGVTAGGIALVSSLANLSVLDLGGLSVTDLVLSSLQVYIFFYTMQIFLIYCLFFIFSLFRPYLAMHCCKNFMILDKMFL